jgi:hypothetical protein
MESLNLAEELQTLVFLMSDLDLGMNNWMSDPFDPPSTPIRRGKVLTAEDLERLGGFARYKDVDGDGIGYRTLPGTDHPKAAYFTRGTGHTENATYSEKPHDWQNNMDRLVRKFNTARTLAPRPSSSPKDSTSASSPTARPIPPCARPATSCVRDHDLKVDYLRVRALPVADVVPQFIRDHKVVYLVEQNRDAQMASILKAEFPELATKIKSILHYNGLPLDAQIGRRGHRRRRTIGKASPMTTATEEKPAPAPKAPKTNRLGLEIEAYQGSASTLCSGCGHDSITNSIVKAFWEMGVQTHNVAKMSGIGCSSKTTAYFMKESHGFNAVHGRMAAIATGTAMANKHLVKIGVSGDGDTSNIGMGNFLHMVRRNVPSSTSSRTTDATA